MQTANTNHGLRAKDLKWYLFGEYPLSNFSAGAEIEDKIRAATAAQMGGALENQNECIERVANKLSALAKEAVVNFSPGRAEATGRMRIYCQKQMIEEGIQGGWGYFVIERSCEAESSSGLEAGYRVDLYIYKEGI